MTDARHISDDEWNTAYLWLHSDHHFFPDSGYDAGRTPGRFEACSAPGVRTRKTDAIRMRRRSDRVPGWCNGSTRDFGSLCPGSSPGPGTSARPGGPCRRPRARAPPPACRPGGRSGASAGRPSPARRAARGRSGSRARSRPRRPRGGLPRGPPSRASPPPARARSRARGPRSSRRRGPARGRRARARCRTLLASARAR